MTWNKGLNRPVPSRANISKHNYQRMNSRDRCLGLRWRVVEVVEVHMASKDLRRTIAKADIIPLTVATNSAQLATSRALQSAGRTRHENGY